MSDTLHECPECGKTFLTELGLRGHSQVHSDRPVLATDGGIESSGSERIGFPIEAPIDAELRVWVRDLIIDARRFDTLANDARKDHPIAPVTKSDAPTFRKEAFKSRRHAQGICRYLSTGSEQEAER